MAIDPVSLAIEAGLFAAQMALTMTQKIKGPRLDDLSVSLADFGTPIPRIWGTRRINPQIIWAEKLREKKKTSKTKGGKYTDYKYYGTWAVLLCDHEIDTVTRIWFDKRLVYQTTGVGPISIVAALLGGNSSQIKLQSGANMRIYTGTETQTQDPRIESWCEDRYGANSCPAYRGSAYIVFQDIPLETVGNRIPQLTVEVVNDKSTQHLYETKTTTQTTDSTFAFSGVWGAYQRVSGGKLEWWDTPTRTVLGTSPDPAFWTGLVSEVGLSKSGTAYCVGTYLTGPNAGTWLCVTPPLGTGVLTAITSPASTFVGRTRVLENADGGLTAFTNYSDALGYIAGATHINHGQCARDFCVDADGRFWVLFHPDGSSNQFTLLNLSNSNSYTFTGLVTRSDVGAAEICHVADYNQFFVQSDGKFYIIDDATMTVTSSGAFSTSVDLPATNPSSTSAWDVSTSTFKEYSLKDGSLIRSLNRTDWLTVSTVEACYDPVNNAVWSRRSGALNQNVDIFYIDRVSPNGVTLQTIVDDVAGWVGLSGQDTSALTQTVYGYSITQGAAKDMLAPLFDIHDVDARPHDFTVQFKVRGSAPSGSYATADFVREGDATRYSVSIQQDTDLPRRVTINFADNDKDQQTNTVIAQRPLDAMDSNREETLDLTTYADTADSAQQKADRYFRRLWNSRERTKLSLTPQCLALEPGDVTTISLDGASRNVRLDKLTISPMQLDCEFVRDETSFAAVNTATTGPEMEGRDDEEIFVPGPAKGFVIDAPFIEDGDNRANPILYYAAGPYAGSFAGAVVGEYDGLDYDTLVGAVDSSNEATWGLATTALATANSNLWDRGNTVNINLRSGTLTSVTDAAINADATLNLAALGADGRWEYIQFSTAALQTDGSYTLSGLKRGRRGTELNTANHAVGDSFILLDHRAEMERGAGDIGDALSFKIESPLRDINTSQAIDLTYDGACLMPYAPCSLKGGRNLSTNDWSFTWVRRTRLGGTWNGAAIPLSEDSESYELVIMNGASEKRVIAVSTGAATYTSAQQVTDWGSNQSSLTIKLYQKSATVGRGFALSATV
jgi:hypothetical protein